jgi:hypothetical protein
MQKKTVEYYRGNKCDRKEEVKHLLTSDNEKEKVVPLKICVQNTVAFAACKVTDKATNKSKTVCKIVETSTNLKYSKDFLYEIYDENNCPEEFYTCPSSILKRLSPTTDKKALAFREESRDILELLAVEKLLPDSLTNLAIGSEIELINRKNRDGSPIILEKVWNSASKTPHWETIDTYQKYKKCDIQRIGYNIVTKA